MTYFRKQLGGWCVAAAAVLAFGSTAVHAICLQDVQPEGRGWVAQQQGQIGARAGLVVKLDRGNIEVHGKVGLEQVEWTARVHIRANSADAARRHMSEAGVTVKEHGDAIEIHCDGSADVTVIVPAKLVQATLRTDSGALILTDVAAKASLITDGGEIHAERIAGQVQAQTGGGSIWMINSGRLGVQSKLETGGGNIMVDAAEGDVDAESGGGNVLVTAARGNLKLETGGGNVTVRQASGALQLETGSGNVEVGDIGGAATLETGGGTIRLASAKGMVNATTGAGAIDCRQLGSGLKAQTGAGGVTAEYSRNARFVESKLETGSGDITVYLPETLSAVIKLTADNPWGHTIRVDFPVIRMTSSHEDGDLRAEGVMNGGGPLLRAETANGSVALLRTK